MKFVELLCVLATAIGCGGGGGTKGGPTTPDHPVAGSKSFELTFQTFASADNGQRSVEQGATLKSGDKIALSVSVSRPAYIYVLQFFPDGSAEVLFPAPGEERAISGTQRVPDTGWFQLDDAVGEENVYVVASAEPLAQADTAVKKTVDAVRTTRKAPADATSGSALSEPTASDPVEVAKPDPVKPDPVKPDPVSPDPVKADPTPTTTTKVATTPIRTNASGGRSRPAPGGLSLRERGLKRVEAGATIRATADEGGVAVFRFTFNHAAK